MSATTDILYTITNASTWVMPKIALLTRTFIMEVQKIKTHYVRHSYNNSNTSVLNILKTFVDTYKGGDE